MGRKEEVAVVHGRRSGEQMHGGNLGGANGHCLKRNGAVTLVTAGR